MTNRWQDPTFQINLPRSHFRTGSRMRDFSPRPLLEQRHWWWKYPLIRYSLLEFWLTKYDLSSKSRDFLVINHILSTKTPEGRRILGFIFTTGVMTIEFSSSGPCRSLQCSWLLQNILHTLRPDTQYALCPTGERCSVRVEYLLLHWFIEHWASNGFSLVQLGWRQQTCRPLFWLHVTRNRLCCNLSSISNSAAVSGQCLR